MATQRYYLIPTISMAILALTAAFPSAGASHARAETPDGKVVLQKALDEHLPVMGHRNWIVVADSAYPAQSRAGIETIYIGGDQLDAVRAVLEAIDSAKHVRGIVYLDSELDSVSDKDAPGVADYRKKLSKLLAKRPVRREPHEDVIAKLDEAAKTFRILILKTDMVLPYTSVFIQLDCGYWNAESEKRLRESLDKRKRFQ